MWRQADGGSGAASQVWRRRRHIVDGADLGQTTGTPYLVLPISIGDDGRFLSRAQARHASTPTSKTMRCELCCCFGFGIQFSKF